MPSSNPSQEWRRLHDLYAKKGDEELLELRDNFEDLTEAAQELHATSFADESYGPISAPALHP
jgi:hypothetical protein